jgi:hypothetical protein
VWDIFFCNWVLHKEEEEEEEKLFKTSYAFTLVMFVNK